ncbi:hypothetical protein BN2475_510034 [Paraburkholderia ribeironis]|uniref:Transposase n=1 Tax=Paraburkholderia ribeironis TaxID=1247936 RepID=A0A1N7SC98_9BURK|nr:hypothetical protein BN2475_510034 [Paraburkholderia ribeironis]
MWEYPDGRIEIRTDGEAIPCRSYDRLAEVDQGAVVEHKRLGHVLQVSPAIQAQRDNSRIGKAPSRTNRGASTRTDRNRPQPGTKKQRELRRPTSSMWSWNSRNTEQRRRNPANRTVGLPGAQA